MKKSISVSVLVSVSAWCTGAAAAAPFSGDDLAPYHCLRDNGPEPSKGTTTEAGKLVYRSSGRCLDSNNVVVGQWQAKGLVNESTGAIEESMLLVPTGKAVGAANFFPSGNSYTTMTCPSDPWRNGVQCSDITVSQSDDSLRSTLRVFYQNNGQVPASASNLTDRQRQAIAEKVAALSKLKMADLAGSKATLNSPTAPRFPAQLKPSVPKTLSGGTDTGGSRVVGALPQAPVPEPTGPIAKLNGDGPTVIVPPSGFQIRPGDPLLVRVMPPAGLAAGQKVDTYILELAQQQFRGAKDYYTKARHRITGVQAQGNGYRGFNDPNGDGTLVEGYWAVRAVAESPASAPGPWVPFDVVKAPVNAPRVPVSGGTTSANRPVPAPAPFALPANGIGGGTAANAPKPANSSMSNTTSRPIGAAPAGSMAPASSFGR